jgi:hypothetical protein
MDHPNEYEALKQNAQQLRKELGIDQPLDRLELQRIEVEILEGLKSLNESFSRPIQTDPECEKLKARFRELLKELRLYHMDRLSRLKLQRQKLQRIEVMSLKAQKLVIKSLSRAVQPGPECEKMVARIKELEKELQKEQRLDEMDRLSQLKLQLQNLESLNEILVS